MDDTPNLKMPYIMAAQAQKHVTHNEAIRALDAIVQLGVVDRDLTVAPPSPVDGDRYIIGAGATAEWAGKDAQVAAFQDNAWSFFQPLEGWICWVADENLLLVWDGTLWSEVSSGGGSVNPTPLLGVNTTADTTNRLAVSSPNTLLSHDGSDHRVKVNKASLGDTSSFLFQDNYSGRAEIGLTGDDDFHFKVSPDGASWKEAITIDRASGAVSFPSSLYAEAAAFSLMGDGGRFSGSPEPTGVTASTFAVPSWLRVINGTIASEHARSRYNSSTYGGSAAALDSDVEQLINQIVSNNYRRYYPEFFVAKIVQGSGTGYPFSFPDSVNRYNAVYTESFMRPVSMTFSYYIKVKSGDVGIYNASTQAMYIDGVLQNGHFVVPNDGNWHHMLIIEDGEFNQHYRYNLDSIKLYMRDTHEALMAFPAAVPGIIKLPVDVGQIPGTRAW